ncbi:MAG: hypothetical protein M0032_07985 [Actinomycetota bacterium]|nr:hypothetical protein [Actinomycetota bacterium]MDA8294415.1 hypothetical protein [Actinomycetota bacterium]
MGRLTNRLARSAFRRARRGGHPLWLVLATAAWLLGRARRPSSPTYRAVVRQGSELVVAVRAPEGRGRRRRSTS